jgi:hypothetical protein
MSCLHWTCSPNIQQRCLPVVLHSGDDHCPLPPAHHLLHHLGSCNQHLLTQLNALWDAPNRLSEQMVGNMNGSMDG